MTAAELRQSKNDELFTQKICDDLGKLLLTITCLNAHNTIFWTNVRRKNLPVIVIDKKRILPDTRKIIPDSDR